MLVELATAIQELVLDTVQRQFVPVVTFTKPVDEWAGNVALVALSVNVHEAGGGFVLDGGLLVPPPPLPSCVTVKSCPATNNAPVRLRVLGLAETK
jgi:hypothetical protein